MNEGTVKIDASAPGDLLEAPAMSAPATLLGIFTQPRQIFKSLAARPRVLAPILLVLAFQLVFGVVADQSGIFKNDAIAKLEAKNAPQEQIDTVTNFMDSPGRYILVPLGPIVRMFFLLFFAALYYFMANLMLGAHLRYIHYLCIAAYGGVVSIFDELAQLGIALSRGTLNVHLGVGAFLGDDLSVPLRLLDTLTDPLLLWVTAVQALGVAIMARKSFGFGALVVAPALLIRVALSAFQH
jgi:Yip1-like protein